MKWSMDKEDWLRTLALLEKTVNLVSELNEENALLTKRVQRIEADLRRLNNKIERR